MNEARPGDLYHDDKGKLWRVVGFCKDPTLTMEEVEPEAQPNPALMLQQMQSMQTPKTLPLPPRRQMHGGVAGRMWDGWKRIWASEAKT